MTPEEFLAYHVHQITTEQTLRTRFSMYFPALEYDTGLIPEQHEGELLHRKTVDGVGVFLYYSNRGKMQFHEHILNLICEALTRRHIAYRRPKQKRGADLLIGKWRIELEIRASPARQPEQRPNLLHRVRSHPEDTIIVLLNKQDRARYMHTRSREIITGNNRYLTVSDFIRDWHPGNHHNSK